MTVIRPRAITRDLSSSGLSNAVSVPTLAALKGLTARPAIVFPQGQSTFNDGWGSPFGWVAGSATAADDVLVVAPTSGEAGRYKRLNSVLYSLGTSPIFTGAYIGPSQKFGAIIDFTAASAAGAETGAVFNMTSAVGSADITTYYKSALAAVATVSSGSASGWAQSNVLNIGAGGTQRGGIVMEADLNNNWGNYTGVPANPYAANFFATGTNTGGYSSAAFIAAFAGNANPMWNYGIIFQGATAINTATIADLTSTAISYLMTGSHTTGIDMSGANISGAAILSPSFRVSGAGIVSIGKTAAPAAGVLGLKTATDINLEFRSGIVDGTAFAINAVNDAANANVPLEINASIIKMLAAATGTSLALTGALTSASATAGIGYAAGAGGTVAQATDKSTGVTLDKVCGTITMNNASLAADTTVAFTLTDSAIAATDLVVVVHDSAGTLGAYSFGVTPGSGSAVISVHNNTPGALAEAIVLRFAVIKAVAA